MSTKEKKVKESKKGAQVASSHVGPHTKPIFETTTRSGAHVVVSQDLTTSKRNPVMELASTAALGETVHNQQIGNVLERTAEALEREARGSRLDSQGQTLARDTEEILLATEKLLLEKNKEEELQHLIRSGRSLPVGVPEGSKEHTSALYNNARILIVELLRSGEFRDISNDVLELFRDLLAERKMHTPAYFSRTTIETVLPVQERVLVEERIHVEERIPVEEKVVKSVYEVKNVGPQATAEPVVEHTVYREKAVPTSTAAESFSTVTREATPTVYTTETCDAPYKPAYTAEYLPSILGSRTAAPSVVTERGLGTGASYETYTTPSFIYPMSQIRVEYYTSEEIVLRERMVDRLMDLLQRIGAKEEFHRAMSSLFALSDAFTHQYKTTSATGKPNEVLIEARKLLENFTGKQEMGLFRKHLSTLLEDARSDEELRVFYKQFQTFCSKGISHPESLNLPETRIEACHLVFHGIDLLHQEEWGNQFRQIIDDLRMLLDNIRKDSTTTEFTSKLEKFARDFAFNEQGKPDLWVIDDSLHQLRLMLVPMLKTHLENIPIDRIEMTSHKFDAVIEDLLFSGADVLPDHLELKIKNKMRVSLQEAERDTTSHKLKLTVDRIKPTLHNLKFYYKKKTGFPKMEDYGVADVALKGEGMSIKIIWKLISKPGQPARVQLISTKCTIDTLSVHFVKEKTKHDLLDRIFVKLLNGTIRRRIASAVAEYLQVKVTEVDLQINKFFEHHPINRLKARADSAFKHTLEKKETKHLAGSTESLPSTRGSSTEEVLSSSRLPPAPSTSLAESTSTSSTGPTGHVAEEKVKTTVIESKVPSLQEQGQKTTV